MHQKLVRIQIFHQELNENADIFTNILHSSSSNSIDQSEFPSIRKLANISPVFKKGDRNSKENYRPVSILSNISKILERCMFRQISSFIDSYLSSNNVRYSLLVILEKCKNAVDKGKCFGALLTNLSKAFECLSHKLLIAKLHAYGFDSPALKLIKVTYQTEKKDQN